MAAELERAGVHWIEVGHGLGLGAAAAGKGGPTDGDLEAIGAAKAVLHGGGGISAGGSGSSGRGGKA